ncbi:DNA-3-methyladenine glycosylase 2 family protein [Verticiella sediminum]|uniref:DNA-3-methyladenine glycosylase II n=1 Tax=Verticiella sediminum TaxID=1247510 RepID=A0A556AWB5_9BURK|nr:DNA-3-methyladenine glycosylase [Verticiella sediminum]TSH96665.1 DNA-3-methyladenine glycosylase 2 family protein [Verticiella sediminum]
MADLLVTEPDYWAIAVGHLKRRDRVLRRIIPQHPNVHLTTRGVPFDTLVRAVVGQQISVKAADAIGQRLFVACEGELTPARLLQLGIERMRAVGLSQRKTEYLLDLAAHFESGRVHPGQWAAMEDEDIIAELTAIRGIGRWTAEMFLIFNLRRPNVLPLDDLGLMKAISLHYFSGEPVTRFEAREVAQAWQPWSTVATWYLWRSLDPVAVEY